MILLILGGIIGAIMPYLAEGDTTFTPLGLPLGVIAGMIIYLVWQGVGRQVYMLTQDSEEPVVEGAWLGAFTFSY